MDIQSIFYTLASIFMILGVILLVTIIYYIWKLERYIDETSKNIKEKVERVVSFKKMEIVGSVGTAVMDFVSKNLKSKFRKRT